MTYLFSYDRKEAWPLMPDTEFVIESSITYKKYNVMMVNPSRKSSNRHLCLRECGSMEEAEKELHNCVEKVVRLSAATVPNQYASYESLWDTLRGAKKDGT